MWGDMGSMMGWGGGWGFLGALHMLLWWVLIILGIVVLVKRLVAAKRDAPASGDRAFEILRECYARGEIDKVAFEQKRSDLRGTRTTPMDRQRREFLKADGAGAS